MPETIRAACAQDAASLAEIDLEANPLPWSESSFRDSIHGSRALVALDEQQRIIGFVMFQVMADESEILSIAVRSDRRRRGTAARLLGAALDSAQAAGARSCHLEVRESNLAAQALYRGIGFLPNGRRKAYYGAGAAREDALLMRLELEEEQRMQVLETDWWTLELPPEWEAEQEDEVVVIEDEDGVSCIEISSLVRDDAPVGDADIAEFCADLREEGLVSSPVGIEGWRGQLFVHDDGEFHWREWFLGQDSHFVYIAYHCLLEHRGMDDSAVDDILSTLEPRRAGN